MRREGKDTMLKSFELQRRPIVVAGIFIALAGIARLSAAAPAPVSTAAAKVRHVFVIVLENKNFDNTFGTSTQDPYLRNTLTPMGALLTQYYGTGHFSLDNYISMISGQSPTPDTDDDCLPGLTGTVGNYNDVASNGNKVVIWSCANPGAAQDWRFDSTTGELVNSNGYCLNDPSDTKTNGTQLVIWECSGDAAQVWKEVLTGSAFTEFENVANGMCVDNPSNSTTNGEKAQVWSCLGDTAQQWDTPDF